MIEIQMPTEVECTQRVPGDLKLTFEKIDHDFEANDKGFEDSEHLEASLLASFKGLMKLYKLQLGENGDRRFLSGGIQQFLNRNPELARQIVDQQPATSHQIPTFDCLPVNVKLHIFSFLGPRDLCRSASVSRDWCCLTGDQILWENRLRSDLKKWHVISHVTNPALYREVDSDWTNKEIYLRCSPEINSFFKRDFFYLHNLSSIFKSLIWPHTPRVTIFGPALDSKVHHLLGSMMYDKNGIFKLVGLVNGRTPGGVGAGVTLQVNNKTLHLTPLYSSTKTTRENANNDQRMQNNRLMNHQRAEDVEEGREEEFEVTKSIRHLCSSNVDAFVYAVNVDEGNKSLSSDRRELFAMLNEKWSAPHIPVLILACVNNTVKRIPCIDVVDQLQLGKLSRPWQVISCDSETLSGIPEGFTWLLEKSRRR